MQSSDRLQRTKGTAPLRRLYLSVALAALSVGVALCADGSTAWAQKTRGVGGNAPITLSPPVVVGDPIDGGPVTAAPDYTPGEIQAGQNMEASPEVARQLGLILKDYAALTPTQQKMETNLLYAARVAKGLPAVSGVPLLTSSVDVLPDNTINCDIKVSSTNTAALVQAIKSVGGTVVGVSNWSKNIRAFLPVLQIESLAGRSDVVAIVPAIVPKPMNSRQHPLAKKDFVGVPYRPSTNLVDGKPKTAEARRAASLAALPNAPLSLPLFPSLMQAQASFGPRFDKEGYYGHQIDVASVSPYNMTGAGIKIGVLSTSTAHIAQVQADGYLGPVTVVADSTMTDGEGTAMLQIVHNLAPDAQLFFATGETGLFADYIVALRDTYGCDIILDDLGEGQPAFSEGDVAQAVNHVTAEGALYFSSAGNQGNNNHYDRNNRGVNVAHHDGECWEGDFAAGGTIVDPAVGVSARLHTFTAARDNSTNKSPVGGVTLPYDLCINGTTNSGSAALQWSDAYGQSYRSSGNNYFIYTTDNTGANILKTGLASPYTPYASCQATNNQRIYVALLRGAPCALRIERTQDGELGDNDTLQLTTEGESDAHNAGRNTLGVAATDAAGTTRAFTTANNTISFSSDGPRRLFWTADSSGNQVPVVPNVHTFAENGAITLLKPDVTAANGVTTDVPGFAPFYGTSAASPHAGAIAGLVLSYGTAASPKTVTVTTGTGATATTYGTTTIIGRNLAPADMKTVLESSAIDNNVGLNLAATSSYDYTGGYGLVMPVPAAQYLQKFFDPTTVGTSAMNATNYRVTWTTNLPASSVVHYGTSKTALNLIARGSGTPATSHTVQVPNVSTTSPVYFTIESATPSGSVSFVGTTPAQLNTVVVVIPTQKSNVVLSNLALTRLASGQIQAIVTLSNTGAGISGAVSITATLGGVTGTPAPAAVGTIAAGKTARATFVFPTVPAGTQTQFVLAGTEGSNTIATTTQVQVP